MKYTKESLIRDFKKIGLKKGDICVVRSFLRQIGMIDGDRSKVVLDALLETVGKDGTIVALTFTKRRRLPLNKHLSRNVFTAKTEPYTGGLPKECLSRSDSIRSKHPTNSFCAIGKNASFLLKEHDENSPCYFPIGQAIKKKGKMLLIGSINKGEWPGFTSAHWAQWLLGLNTKSRYSGKYGIYYLDRSGQKKLFVSKEIGGCHQGFYKFYKHYKAKKILHSGKIGDAPALLIRLDQALPVELELIRKNPRFPLCDNPACKMCRIGYYFCDKKPYQFWLNPRVVSKLAIAKLKRLLYLFRSRYRI